MMSELTFLLKEALETGDVISDPNERGDNPYPLNEGKSISDDGLLGRVMRGGEDKNSRKEVSPRGPSRTENRLQGECVKVNCGKEHIADSIKQAAFDNGLWAGFLEKDAVAIVPRAFKAARRKAGASGSRFSKHFKRVSHKKARQAWKQKKNDSFDRVHESY